MSEQSIDAPKAEDQFSDILLVFDKKKKKIEVVKGIDKNGELKTMPANKKNESQFIRVDKHGDLFSNFFSNFLNQLKNPTHFIFFRVSAHEAISVANKMQKEVDNPTKEGNKLFAQHKIEIDYKQQNNKIMETTQSTMETSEYRFKLEQIDWNAMSNLGLSKERLEKMKLLDPLLKGYKTNELVPISLDLGTSITRMDARLSLQTKEDGQVVVAIHGIRKEPQLNFPFFGHEFTKEDKENLLKTGNMGRVVDLTNPKTGEKISSIISVDRLTKELIALRTDRIKIPDEIKGVKLEEQQKQTLAEGKALYIEGMISKKGEPFNATVQFNADKCYLEFLFDRTNNMQSVSQQQDVPRVFRGKELDEQQYQKFQEGQTVYLSGLIDKKGKEYQGYITFNKDTAKTDFSFDNPNKMKEKAQPKEESKTQVAVNSEGKTNEATKNIKEPLKTEQNHLDSKKQQQEQEKPKATKKSTGRKI
ncbi:Protein of unknown function [Flavobacterium flevense]|uniref:DUF3945 domain-containing protein n=1 Tax=Flavobacterium flevense TaxID=983 RepID=A0A4Y4B0D4_9FLAO|nr:DUF3945 domain-containing protein [Flavobacterium flevense]GEC73816.1 hypothetical protein FFL01_33550 [Flavobacterium flevense]SHM22697.1 Protein of unknown function [Flavobacterium flevense]